MFKDFALKAWAWVVAYLKARLAEKTTKAAIVAVIINHLAALSGVDVEALAGIEPYLVDILAGLTAALPTPKLKRDAGQANSPGASAFLAVGLLFLLSACGALGANKQQYAGINQVVIETGPGCGVNPLQDESRTCDLKMIDGKEKGTVKVKVTLADGTLYEYEASDEKAFEGQKTRAEVDKAVVDEVGKIVDKAADLVKPDAP